MVILRYQPRDGSKGKSRFFPLGVATAIGTFWWAVLYPGVVVNGLPRSAQGESVVVPFIVCAVPYLLVPALLPAVFVRTRRARILCFLCLTACACVWYFAFGFRELLSKAWARGL